jgi:hypothetical protein
MIIARIGEQMSKIEINEKDGETTILMDGEEIETTNTSGFKKTLNVGGQKVNVHLGKLGVLSDILVLANIVALGIYLTSIWTTMTIPEWMLLFAYIILLPTFVLLVVIAIILIVVFIIAVIAAIVG